MAKAKPSYYLHAGDEGYGPVCPTCGGRKDVAAHECADCRRESVGGNAVDQVRRRESIITFRERDTGQFITRQCFGATRAEQVGNGLLSLPPGRWEVECRSTPASILQDLRGREVDGRRIGRRVP